MSLRFIPGLVCLAALLGGCQRSDPPAEKPAPEKKPVADKPAHDHSGWWCDEHGVPENICTRCNGKLIAKFQKKGDWCEEHERPKTQCFKCDPKLQEKFAKHYRDIEKKEPPPITDP